MPSQNREFSEMSSPLLWTANTIEEWVNERLAVAQARYRADCMPQAVAFRELCSQWQWAKRSDVYTHLLHRYPAKLLAYIPIFFLSSSYATPDDIVLDPFAGTGTVLLESITHPYFPRSCYGVEINPLARLIAQVKTTPLSPEILLEKAEKLYQMVREFKGRSEIPEFPNRNYWFRPKVQEDIAKVRACIEQLEATPDERDFFWACLSSIIRDVSWADPKVAPPVKLRAEKFPRERQVAIEQVIKKKSTADVLKYFRSAVDRNIVRMRQLHAACNGKPTDQQVRAEIIWDDARSIKKGHYAGKGKIVKDSPQTLDGQVGLVITSPPYINAQKYIRTTKLELWCLGLETPASIIDLDTALIGTERVYHDEYKELVQVGNTEADRLLGVIYETSPSQAGIASRYFRDMREVTRTIHRLLKPGGYFIMVVGDNTICNLSVENHTILAQIAQENDQFAVESVLVDSIRSRGLITKRHATAGVIPEEWVIVMRKHSTAIKNNAEA